MSNYSRYTKELEKLESQGNYRQLHHEEPGLLDLCSNDYLGLNHNEEVFNHFMDNVWSKDLRFSSSASRLLSINSGLHNKLEQLIAAAYQQEAALLFNSGYHANVGLLASLAGKNDLIIADKYVHASIIDGAQLSRADFIRYTHLDYKHLEKLLKNKRKNYDQVFIVSESIFSMDGDIADIQKIAEIKNRHNCLLYIDEAHGLGVRGKNGLGCIEEQDSLNEVDIFVGPLGKAMASVGAFVTCRKTIKEYLINSARPFIFSTALPPINIAWTMHVFKLLPHLNSQRDHLSAISVEFSHLLGTKPESHIIPYITGENKTAIKLSQKLKEEGFNALPVRYPTVPKGTARLRFSLGAHLQLGELKPSIEIIKQHESDLDQ